MDLENLLWKINTFKSVISLKKNPQKSMTELCTSQAGGTEVSSNRQHLILAHCQCLRFNLRDCVCSYCMKWNTCPLSLLFTRADRPVTALLHLLCRTDMITCFVTILCSAESVSFSNQFQMKISELNSV